MPTIHLETIINSSIEVCFDLSRSIDLHKISTAHTNEEAIEGTTSGLIGLGEQVTWRARHFGVVQTLTTKITEFDSPNYFVDEMISGAFKRFRHEHRFEQENDQVKMIDVFDYTSPLGFLGSIADQLFLKKYMTKLLVKRNEVIKDYAESGKWKFVLTK